jgi:hypothetical protein
VIAAAIRDTNDYETLIFEDGYTYQLTEPIFFTEYGERSGNRISGRNKTGIHFLGNGCIITSNIEKLSVKGYLRANESGTDYSTATTLAVVSDNVNRHDGKGNALGITTIDEYG